MLTRIAEFHTVVVETGEADTAAKILDAAIQEFDECGYTEASVNDIAHRAGASKSLVSYHFPTKASLAATIVNLAHPSGVFMGTQRQAIDPLDALVEGVEHVAACVAHHQLARVTLSLRNYREVRSIRRQTPYGGWLTRVTDYLEEARRSSLIPESTDVPRQARLVVAGASGLINMATGSGDYFTLVDDVVQVTRDRIRVL